MAFGKEAGVTVLVLRKYLKSGRNGEKVQERLSALSRSDAVEPVQKACTLVSFFSQVKELIRSREHGIS
jgi:hypothetical protein